MVIKSTFTSNKAQNLYTEIVKKKFKLNYWFHVEKLISFKNTGIIINRPSNQNHLRPHNNGLRILKIFGELSDSWIITINFRYIKFIRGWNNIFIGNKNFRRFPIYHKTEKQFSNNTGNMAEINFPMYNELNLYKWRMFSTINLFNLVNKLCEKKPSQNPPGVIINDGTTKKICLIFKSKSRYVVYWK